MKKFNTQNFLDNKKVVIILSLLIAIITWVVISVTVNPDQSMTISDIPVTIPMEKSAAEAQGLSVISGGDAKVSVMVRGKRYKVGALKPGSFKAVADISNVTAAGEYTLKISVTKVNDDSDYNIISVSSETVKVRFDHLIEKEIPLEAQAEGIKAKDGYILDTVYAMNDEITLKGPQSDIEKVARAVVVTDRKETISQSLTTDGELVLYDAENKKLELQYVTHEPDQLQLTVSISQRKTLPLSIKFSNIPDGMTEKTLKYTISPSTIEVTGASEVISNVTEINLGFVDFRKIDVGSSFTFQIPLPAGFTNVKDVKTATVKFETDDFVSKNFTVNGVKVVNPPDGYNVTLDTQKFTVKIVGTQAAMNVITDTDLVAVVDFSEITVTSGQFKTPIKITIPGQSEPCWAVGVYEALVTAREK